MHQRDAANLQTEIGDYVRRRQGMVAIVGYAGRIASQGDICLQLSPLRSGHDYSLAQKKTP